MPAPLTTAEGLPYRITGPTEPASPLVLASPHSGREYPGAFLAQSRLSLGQLRRAEDAYVDELLAAAVAVGAPMIAARYGRAYLDLNRDADEIDPAMVADPLPPSPGQASDRVAAGLGILPRIAAHGLDIYASRLRLADVELRVKALHRPYHAALDMLVGRALRRHGFAILLDCHSMPTPPGPNAPQFVLGDLHGTTAAPALVEAIEAEIAAQGFRVARNTPYAGGYTTRHHSDRLRGVHVVQIEVDRALYMDPARLARHGGFALVAATLARIVEMLLERAPGLGLLPERREAAE
ncbi:N-formylglutamate amidohydrolase [Sphingoaurantiacus capsulatus]|uniref:N-formylglutamate amidohydrolase n=1 Tax=Sphingoaurantiacus capsulatus TaxID=1771310 RepID=A0ABV7XCT1_9SPHN